MRHIVVIGGGITGLSAAFYARKYFDEAAVPMKITIIEKEAQFGGKVATLRREGFIIERGPDSFLARKKPMIDLIYELGMEHELVRMNSEANRTFILNDSKLQRMPPGLALGIPTRLAPFMRSELLSLKGKARTLFDLLLPRRGDTGDESLGHFLERRFGKEMRERIIEPLLAGIYAGDTQSLSLLATFPHLKQMELNQRSLILGMKQSTKHQSSSSHLPEHVRGSMFLTLRHGLSSLIERMIERLDEVDRINGQEVAGLRKQDQHMSAGDASNDASPQSKYQLILADGTQLVADAVILAIPAFSIARLLPDIHAARSFGMMDYISVANVVVSFDRHSLTQLPMGSGFLVPKPEGRFITACTWTSSKWQHTAPKDKILIRCYVGRAGQEEWLDLQDQEIAERTLYEIRELLNITAKPDFVLVNRLPRSMPQYGLGHTERIAQLRAELMKEMPGIYAAGAAFEGVGLPDCIRQGRDAAKQAAAHLSSIASIFS